MDKENDMVIVASILVAICVGLLFMNMRRVAQVGCRVPKRFVRYIHHGSSNWVRQDL